MERLGYARGFRDLVVYKKAASVATAVVEVTKAFPKEEMCSLTDQIRRSSRLIGAQIAEARAKRRYEKHFISKLTDADAEQQETQHWIDSAEACGYLDRELSETLNADLHEIGCMLNSMISKSDRFCCQHGDTVKETTAEYSTTDTDNW